MEEEELVLECQKSSGVQKSTSPLEWMQPGKRRDYWLIWINSMQKLSVAKDLVWDLFRTIYYILKMGRIYEWVILPRQIYQG